MTETIPDSVIEKMRSAHALKVAELFDTPSRHSRWIEKMRSAHALKVAELFDTPSRHSRWGQEVTAAKINEAWWAALKAAEAAGFVMVPAEATEAMKTKGRFQLKIEQMSRKTYDDWAAQIFAAMIAARPKVP